jgi:hypothetical protein
MKEATNVEGANIVSNDENMLIRLIYWRNPILSTMVFLTIQISCYLVAIQDYSVVTLLSYLVFVQLLVCLCYVNGTKWWLSFQGKSIPSDQFFSSSNVFVTPEYIHSLVAPTAVLLDDFVHHVIDLCRCVNNTYTISVLCATVLLSIVGRYVSGVAMISLGTCLLFFGGPAMARYGDRLQPVINQLRALGGKRKEE